MILDEVKKYFEKNCPLLEGKKLSANSLGEKAHSCTLEVAPSPSLIQRYPDGGSLRQFVFVLATREYFDRQVQEQLKVNEFYEKFAEWLEKQNDAGNFPALGEGKRAVGWEVLSAGYLYDVEMPKARYQIQLRLIYEKD